jgi:hypothetical protein
VSGREREAIRKGKWDGGRRCTVRSLAHPFGSFLAANASKLEPSRPMGPCTGLLLVASLKLQAAGGVNPVILRRLALVPTSTVSPNSPIRQVMMCEVT